MDLSNVIVDSMNVKSLAQFLVFPSKISSKGLA